MVIQERAIRAEREQRIVQRPAADARFDALGHTHDQGDSMLARDLADRPTRIAGNDDAVRRHPREHAFDRSVIPQRHIATHVEPRGISRQPRLGKHDERRAAQRRVGGECARPLDSRREIGGDLGLDDRDFTHHARGHPSLSSRIARPAPRMLSKRISEYLRDKSTPCAPPSNAAFTA
jgi:hypothetical protein